MSYPMLKDAIKWMADEEAEGRFNPVLEADLVAFLYHRLLLTKAVPSTAIHVQTRVLGSQTDKQKFDLVIGDVSHREGDGRLAVMPRLILEIKMAGADFTGKQCGRRLRDTEKDLLKLSAFGGKKGCQCAILVWTRTPPGRVPLPTDESRRARICDCRNRKARGVKIFWVTRGGEAGPPVVAL